MLNFFYNTKISQKMFFLVFVFFIGIVSFFLVSLTGSNQIRINGKLYNKIIQGKDVIADILPPPEYIIEPYLLVYEIMNETNKSELNKKLDKMKKLETEYRNRHKYWQENMESGELKDKLVKESYIYADNFFKLLNNQFLEILKSNDKEKIKKLVLIEIKAEYEEHRLKIDDTVKIAEKMNLENEMEAEKLLHSNIIQLISMLLLVLFISIGIAYYIIKMISNNINNVSKASNKLSDGDLRIRLDEKYNDEIGLMNQNLNLFLSKLMDIISEIYTHSTCLSSGSENLNSNMENIGSSIQNLENVSSNTAAAIEDLSNTTYNISQNAETLLKCSEETLSLAENGSESLGITIKEINKIKNAVNLTSLEVKELGEKTKEIGNIVSVINDIATQTNLLALNAAIESARAGEAGKGFSVVADEVRKLAEKTTEATKEINSMIKEIQFETKNVIIQMEEINSEVEEGVEKASHTDVSLNKIVNQTQDLKNMINSIANTTKEQAISSDEIAKQTENINRNIEESYKKIVLSLKEIQNISSISEELYSIVNQFKIENKNVNCKLPKLK